MIDVHSQFTSTLIGKVLSSSLSSLSREISMMALCLSKLWKISGFSASFSLSGIFPVTSSLLFKPSVFNYWLMFQLKYTYIFFYFLKADELWWQMTKSVPYIWVIIEITRSGKANIHRHMSTHNTLNHTWCWLEVEMICESQWYYFAIKSKEKQILVCMVKIQNVLGHVHKHAHTGRWTVYQLALET